MVNKSRVLVVECCVVVEFRVVVVEYCVQWSVACVVSAPVICEDVERQEALQGPKKVLQGQREFHFSFLLSQQ